MIDARPLAEKLQFKIYGPKECEAKMRARAAVAGTLDTVPPDASIRIDVAAGVKTGEPRDTQPCG